MSKAEKIIQKLALPLIVIAAVFIMLAFVFMTKSKVDENNGYVRVINCIIVLHSEHDTQPVANDIENCYVQVEQQMHIKLQRYDTNVYN